MKRPFLCVKRLLLKTAAVAVLALLPVLAVSAAEAEDTKKDGQIRLPENVFVEGINIGGKTPKEARLMLEAFLSAVENYRLVLNCEAKEVTFTFKELGVRLADRGAIDEICNVCRRKDFMRQLSELCSISGDGLHFKLDFVCDEAEASCLIEGRRAEIDTEARDASLVRKNGEFIVTPEIPGQTIDSKATAKELAGAIKKRWREGEKGFCVSAVLHRTNPEHCADELLTVKERLGAYETSFAGSSKGRMANIRNGASKLENTVVYPGEEYSFLQAMTPFSEENGYFTAGTYVNGRNTPGLGGGICQVSSTLYNAVLRAELQVTERTNHMMTVGYVPLGADATIANPSIDFKFRNDTKTPVLIEAFTSGTMLYVNIYGKETRPKNRTVEFVTVTEETVQPGADVVTYDASKPADYFYVEQNAHTGYTAAFYKNIYIDNQLTEQILINRSQYGAYPRYVICGSG